MRAQSAPEPQFRVIVSGDVLPERARAEVLEKLAELFHSTPARMERLLRGRPVALTRAYSRQRAERVCAAIETAGAACRMEAIWTEEADVAGDLSRSDGDGERAGDGGIDGDGEVAGDDGEVDGDDGEVDLDGDRDHAGDGDLDGDGEVVGDGDGDRDRDRAGDGDGDRDHAGADDLDEDDLAAARARAEAGAGRAGALAHFVGVNIAYYQRQFAKFGVAAGRPKFALTWHWPAFFAFFLWAAYRKLWHWAGAHLLGGLVLVTTFDPGPAYLAWALIWPALANYLYYRHACRRLFGAGGVLDDELRFGRAGGLDEEAFFAAAEDAGGVSRAAVAVGVLLVFLSSMAFNHLITERVLQRAGSTGIGRGGELLPPAAGALQRGDGASIAGSEELSARAIRSIATLNVIAAGLKAASSEEALGDPELALSLVQGIIARKRFADGWGSVIAVRRDASGQVALVSAGPDRAFDTADDILRYIDLSEI